MKIEKMSQEQPRRPQEDQEPIKYGGVLSDVEGELAQKPVVLKDAATMQQAETVMLGQTTKSGVAEAMQSAARRNESAGLVSHDDASNISDEQDVSITATDVPGRRIITEAVGVQVL